MVSAPAVPFPADAHRPGRHRAGRGGRHRAPDSGVCGFGRCSRWPAQQSSPNPATRGTWARRSLWPLHSASAPGSVRCPDWPTRGFHGFGGIGPQADSSTATGPATRARGEASAAVARQRRRGRSSTDPGDGAAVGSSPRAGTTDTVAGSARSGRWPIGEADPTAGSGSRGIVHVPTEALRERTYAARGGRCHPRMSPESRSPRCRSPSTPRQPVDSRAGGSDAVSVPPVTVDAAAVPMATAPTARRGIRQRVRMELKTIVLAGIGFQFGSGGGDEPGFLPADVGHSGWFAGTCPADRSRGSPPPPRPATRSTRAHRIRRAPARQPRW